MAMSRALLSPVVLSSTFWRLAQVGLHIGVRQLLWSNMRFGSTAKVLAKRVSKYHRIS